MASTYSAVTDLLIGDLPLPAYVDKQKYVDDAANEIDSYLGYIYVTPIDMEDPTSVAQPARLLIKRIASHLSTGRIILAIAVSSEDTNLHAYGKRMVDEALAALKQVVDGVMPITGATPIDSSSGTGTSGPIVANIDTFSTVEAFYQKMARPTWRYGEGESSHFPRW